MTEAAKIELPFIHLRVHTAYSLSEGAIRIKQLPDLCRQFDMPACAITDTNNLFGGMDFSGALSAAGIQPIIGCQLSVATTIDDTSALKSRPRGPMADPLVILAQDAVGYGNLLALLAHAYTQADAGTPHVPLEVLCAHATGLILLTGGAGGPIGRLLTNNNGAGGQDAAANVLQTMKEAFGNRLYIEIARHGLSEERATEPHFLEMAERFELPIVATNDCYFATPDMAEAHDVLLCVAQGVHIAESERRRLTPEHVFKSGAAMRALFADLPDAIDNTALIARRCAFMVESRKPILPPFIEAQAEGDDANEDSVLRAEAAKGLERRLEKQVLPGLPEEERQTRATQYRERLAYELDVICRMGFAGYFLIVADFIRWAKEHDIPVGPGRGSGAGSVAAWALTITDLDPIRFGLLFERFLNPERVSMPDFDIDFCQDRRDEVIGYVHQKYGADKVAQIITFGKLQARAVLRDVGRVLGMPYPVVDRICKLVPNNPAKPVTLAEAIKGEPQLQQQIASDETIARLVELALKLEGLYRHASTHAAGVVIGDRPLESLIPLYRDPRTDMLVTGFNMKWVEQAGLVKFDFLGLKTLTVLVDAVALVRKGRGIDIDLSSLPLDDAKTYEMLGRGETVGVFQLESAGMRDTLRKLRPDTFEDIIAVVALYRPGPMENIPSYIKRKHGEEEVDCLYPSLTPILSETYGIMIYQEQVMQIAQVLSGYSLGGADLLRRAMGKKNQEEMDRQRETFIKGAVERSVSAKQAEHIFDLVNKFAGYGFNKSHAAAYALIAYQTAYLKANYPVEFFAGSMIHELTNTDKLNVFRQELDRMRIPLLPPDINASDVAFTVEYGAEGGGSVRFGLAAIKNVGEQAMRDLVAERVRGGRFKSLADLASRMSTRNLNKRQMENLARAGAFDSILKNRRKVYENSEIIVRAAAASGEERASGQMGLFGGTAVTPSLLLSDVEDWSPLERLKQEMEACGFYLSAHPLDGFGFALKRLKVVPFADVVARGVSGAATLAGTVIGRKDRTSGKGNRYAFVQLSDVSGVFEITVFSELLGSAGELLVVGNSLLVKVTAQVEGEQVRCIAQSIESLENLVSRMEVDLDVYLDRPEPLPAIRDLLAGQRRGRGQVRLMCSVDALTEVEIRLQTGYALSRPVSHALRQLPGVLEVREV